MKYIVEVNAKWLVSIEAESALQAEHKALDLDGIWGALAFDRAALKTDTFAGAVQDCEMISFAKLEEMANDTAASVKFVKSASDAQRAAQAEVDRIAEELEAAKAKLRDVTKDLSIATFVMNENYKLLGRERR